MKASALQVAETMAAHDGGYQPYTQNPTPAPDDIVANGPSRFTIWVPTEEVTLNMGNGVGISGLSGSEAAPKDHVQVDAGFVAQTERHIHFHTFGEPQSVPFLSLVDDTTVKHETVALTRTLLRLGTPARVVSAGDSYGSAKLNTLKTPTHIGSAYSLPYRLWDGYAMITEGASYQESWGNNLIVSGRADLRLAGMRMVQIGSPGDVHIMADGSTIADIVANKFDDDTVNESPVGLSAADKATRGAEFAKERSLTASGRWVDQLKPWKWFNEAVGILGEGLSVFTTIDAAYNMKYGRPPEEAKTGWKVFGTGTTGDAFLDNAGLVGSFIAPALGLYTVGKGLKDLVSPSTGTSSSVTLYGNATFNAYGKSGATLHSDLSVSVSSLVAASVTSSVSTSVSSLAIMGVSGTLTTVSGMLSVGMSSQYGSASVRGKTSATLASWGKTFVASNDELQINSMNKSVYLHGKAGFYVGCGAGAPTGSWGGVTYADGPGYGIVGDASNGLQIGKLDKANNFANPVPTPLVLMVIDSQKMYLRHNEATITLQDDQIKIGGKNEQRVLIG